MLSATNIGTVEAPAPIPMPIRIREMRGCAQVCSMAEPIGISRQSRADDDRTTAAEGIVQRIRGPSTKECSSCVWSRIDGADDPRATRP
jgi:hypothetical protein